MMMMSRRSLVTVGIIFYYFFAGKNLKEIMQPVSVYFREEETSHKNFQVYIRCAETVSVRFLSLIANQLSKLT